MTIIFRDSFESANATAWQGTAVYSGDCKLEFLTEAAHSGSYGAKCTAIGYAFPWKGIGGSMTNARAYFKFVNTPTTGNKVSLINMYGDLINVIAYIKNTGTNIVWGIQISANGVDTDYDSTTTVSPNIWYSVEVEQGLPATQKLYINGTLTVNAGQTITALGEQIYAGILSSWSSPAQILYMDDVFVADTYIGPNEPALPTEAIYSECDNASEWVTGVPATQIPTVDTADFAPIAESTASIKVEDTDPASSWIFMINMRGTMDFSMLPTLNLWVKLSKQASAWIDVITSPWASHQFPITFTANTWTEINIDLTSDVTLDLTKIMAVRLNYQIMGGPATAHVDRIRFLGTGTLPAPQISIPTVATVRVGSTYTFIPVIRNTYVYSIDWFLNGVKVATGPTYDYTPTAVGQAQVYAVITDSTSLLTGTSQVCNVDTTMALTPPNNPTPWHTVGHKIIDALGQEVIPRGLGRMFGGAYDMWSKPGEPICAWAQIYMRDKTEIAARMDATFECYRNYWYVNSFRVQGVMADWWWKDLVTPEMAQDQYWTTVSDRDMWELMAQRAKAHDLSICLCLQNLLARPADGGRGGVPGSETAECLAFLQTIDPTVTRGNTANAWALFWQSVAQRLGQYDNVMFEMYNEPNLDDAAAAGFTDAAGVKQRYFNCVIASYHAIRATGAKNLFLVQWDFGIVPAGVHPQWGWQNGSGFDWVVDLHNQLKASLGGAEPENVVYTTHCYRNAPIHLYTWGVNYEEVKANIMQADKVPLIRTEFGGSIDVPMFFNEMGCMIGDTGGAAPLWNLTEQDRQDQYGWLAGLLKASREVGIGCNIEWWQPAGWWSTEYVEALLDAPRPWTANPQNVIWPVGAESPAPTIPGQIFIDAYSADAHVCPEGYHWDATLNACVLDNPPTPKQDNTAALLALAAAAAVIALS